MCHSPTLLIFFGDTIKSNCSRALSTEKYLVSRANGNVSLEKSRLGHAKYGRRHESCSLRHLPKRPRTANVLHGHGTAYQLNITGVANYASLPNHTPCALSERKGVLETILLGRYYCTCREQNNSKLAVVTIVRAQSGCRAAGQGVRNSVGFEM